MARKFSTVAPIAAVFVVLAAGVAHMQLPAAQRYGTWGVDLDAMDRSVRAGDDFFEFTGGTWLKSAAIPPDRTSVGSFRTLSDLSEARVRQQIEAWTADKLEPGSDESKVATLYRAFLDDAAVEKADAAPLQPYLDRVKSARTREDLASLMGRSGLASRSFFSLGVSDDQKNPSRSTLYLGQSGLGLPDREYYLRDTYKAQKDRYQQYVADLLRLAAWPEPDATAAEVVALETRLAEAHWTRAESRDRDKTYNPTTWTGLETSAPGFPWKTWATAQGLGAAPVVVMRQSTAVPRIAQVFADAPVATLQAWAAAATVDDLAPLLSKRFVTVEWEFRARFLSGAQEPQPRWRRGVSLSERAMGEAIGRAYVTRYFPPQSKAKMERLVADLQLALKARIEKLEWMSPETKVKALEKLSKFTVKIGYPTKWRDYGAFKPVAGDLVGNAERLAEFQHARAIKRLDEPVDRAEWSMTPQTVNAYYNATRNEIVFPAAILQPPFFDPEADPAVNYGAIGAVIGHEITHGFDDQGRKSDGDGVLRDWWTASDAAKFEVQAARYGAQFEAIEFPNLPGQHIIGRLTMGENIGDLGGILMALDAYHMSLGGKPSPVLDGFTGDQRVFMGWAQVWRGTMRDGAMRQQLATNPHSPDRVRAYAPLRNVDAWYDAFGVKPGDRLFIKPEDRVRIW